MLYKNKKISPELEQGSVQDEVQEHFCYYLSGFVDGEGCFSVSFRKRKKLNTGIEVTPSFAIAQKKSKQNYALLNKIRLIFQGGAIRDDGKGCYKYETRKITHLRNQVIPFFLKYPLYTSKASDFLCFSEICSLITSKQHLNKNGLSHILVLSKSMNSSGIRKLPIHKLQALLAFPPEVVPPEVVLPEVVCYT